MPPEHWGVSSVDYINHISLHYDLKSESYYTFMCFYH